MFVRAPNNTRKNKIIWQTLEQPCTAHSLQVHVGKGWCVKHCATVTGKCLTSVPCVAYDEKEDLLVLFHGDDVLVESHDSSPDKVDEVLGAFEIKRMPRIGPTVGREGVFLHRRIRWNESGSSYRPDPKHVDALVDTLSLEDTKLVATPFTRDAGKGQANTLCELSLD